MSTESEKPQSLVIDIPSNERIAAINQLDPNISPQLRIPGQILPNMGILGSGSHASVISTLYNHTISTPTGDITYQRQAAIKIMPQDVRTEASTIRASLGADPNLLREVYEHRMYRRNMTVLAAQLEGDSIPDELRTEIENAFELTTGENYEERWNNARAIALESLARKRARLIADRNLPENGGRILTRHIAEQTIPAGFVAEHSCAQRSFSVASRYVPDVYPEPILVELLNEQGEVTAEMPGIMYKQIEGRSLKDQRPSTLPQAATIMRQIASGFDQLHAHGIFNHDPGPHNVIVDFDRIDDSGALWIPGEGKSSLAVMPEGNLALDELGTVKVRTETGEILSGRPRQEGAQLIVEGDKGIIYKATHSFKEESGVISYTNQTELTGIKLIDFGLASFVDEEGNMRLLQAGFVISSPNTFNPVCIKEVDQSTTFDDLSQRGNYTVMGILLHSLGLPPIIDFDVSASWQEESSRADLLTMNSVLDIIVNAQRNGYFDFPPQNEFLLPDNPILAGIPAENLEQFYYFVNAYAAQYFDVYFFNRSTELRPEFASSTSLVETAFNILTGKITWTTIINS